MYADRLYDGVSLVGGCKRGTPVEEGTPVGPERLLGILPPPPPAAADVAPWPNAFAEEMRCICCGCCCWLDAETEDDPKTAIRSLSRSDGPCVATRSPA